MPVGLSPATVFTIKSKSAAISISYPNLSTLSLPPKAAGAAAYLPNGRRLISAGGPCARSQSSSIYSTKRRYLRDHISDQHGEVCEKDVLPLRAGRIIARR